MSFNSADRVTFERLHFCLGCDKAELKIFYPNTSIEGWSVKTCPLAAIRFSGNVEIK